MDSSANADAMERGVAVSSTEFDEKKEHPQPSPTSTTLTSGSVKRFDNAASRAYSIRSALKSMFSRRESGSDGQSLIVRKFKDCPRGYPNLAVFLDSSEEFMVYRRFGYLQSRIILNKQDQLRELEKRLDREDKDDALIDYKLLMCRDKDEIENRPRVKLLVDIEKCFKEYAELLGAAHTLAGLSKPAKRDYTSVRNYIDDESPLIGEEAEYILCKEDLITIRPGRENAWLDAFVEKFLQKISCPPIKYIFCSPEMREKADENTILYDKTRINALVTVIITFIIIALLILPIYFLWHISQLLETSQTTAITIGVLLVFTLVFSTVLSIFTRAKRHEILGAAAA
ncbi:hypothetical protein OIDMADRAFT_184533 [Oidiodendron maius Zn]|uniref:DUF6594 domain-containing protein n=1 Tax=Oidiodendron maius (strain Zn) TaxID=913774 RepID=A0A0C3GD81_OIDMZ|nr:hypothetical protein OIDMADRAFT_184533 [Oidiodendron maius Zn]